MLKTIFIIPGDDFWEKVFYYVQCLYFRWKFSCGLLVKVMVSREEMTAEVVRGDSGFTHAFSYFKTLQMKSVKRKLFKLKILKT